MEGVCTQCRRDLLANHAYCPTCGHRTKGKR